MARAEFIKQANKPNPVVTAEDIARAKAGEEGAASYYKWKFRFGGTHYSKKAPRPSQLTQSEYYGAVYSLQEEIEDFEGDAAGLREARDEWASRATEIGEECQEKFDNLPEGFQQGSTGELLEQRAEAMQEWASDLEAVDLDDVDFDEEPEEGDEDRPDQAEWVREKLEELMTIAPDVE